MEIIKNIAAIIGLILSVISLITLCTKGGRSLIYHLVKNNTKELKDENQQQTQDIENIKIVLHTLSEKFDQLAAKVSAIEEVSEQQCRDTIKEIYYKYQASKKIPLYERKTADKAYDIYTRKYNGNSYAKLLYGEICKWEIDTISYPDLNE